MALMIVAVITLYESAYLMPGNLMQSTAGQFRPHAVVGKQPYLIGTYEHNKLASAVSSNMIHSNCHMTGTILQRMETPCGTA